MAALTSLMHILHDVNHHPSPPVSINKQQVESLTRTVTFLQGFLETYNSPVANRNEADPLEIRIAEAAYAVQDEIESHIVDAIKLRRSSATDHLQIDSGEETETHHLQMDLGEETSETHHLQIDLGEETGAFSGSSNQSKPTMWSNYFGCFMKPRASNQSKPMIWPNYEKCQMEPIDRGGTINYVDNLYRGLHKVVEDMQLVKKKVMEVSQHVVEAQLLHRSVSCGGLSRSSVMVGFDDVLLEIMHKLTNGQDDRQLQAIPIVGMGGIGKTTLAKNVYAQPFVKKHFDICAWVIISQNFDTREILCELLSQANKKSKEEMSEMSENDVGSALHKYLFNRRFIIVMDDMWSVDAWDKMQNFFPDNWNGSRIVVTTRQSKLSSQLNSNYRLRLKLLDEVSSWDLFSNSVFGEESCPLELEEIGKKIVENCKGLPLAIVVVGGLLKKVEHTKEGWESIRKNSSSVVNSADEDFCLNILK